MAEITKALEEAATNDDVFFTVLTGTGDYYCSGFDMKSGNPSGMDMEEMLQYRINTGKWVDLRWNLDVVLKFWFKFWHRSMMAAFIDFPKLLIAIVNGPSVGAATTTLALCDLVFCTTRATFWTPFASLGLCAEGCSSYLFPRIMGNAMVIELNLTVEHGCDLVLITCFYRPTTCCNLARR